MDINDKNAEQPKFGVGSRTVDLVELDGSPSEETNCLAAKSGTKLENGSSTMSVRMYNAQGHPRLGTDRSLVGYVMNQALFNLLSLQQRRKLVDEIFQIRARNGYWDNTNLVRMCEDAPDLDTLTVLECAPLLDLQQPDIQVVGLRVADNDVTIPRCGNLTGRVGGVDIKRRMTAMVQSHLCKPDENGNYGITGKG